MPQFAYQPFSRCGVYSILSVTAMHLYQAWLLYVSPDALGATDLSALVMAFQLVYLPNDIPYLQFLMCVAAALAIYGVLFRIGRTRFAYFVPQHLTIGAMAWGGLLATCEGHYLDHTPMGWAHISADQIGYVALFLTHSLAIWRRCRDPDG